MPDVEEIIARVRRRIIERQRTEVPPAGSVQEAEAARLCMWTSPDQYEVSEDDEQE